MNMEQGEAECFARFPFSLVYLHFRMNPDGGFPELNINNKPACSNK